MADCRADDTAGQTRRPAAFGECARGAKRDFLRPVDRLPMESLAQGPAAEEHGPRLSRTLELGWQPRAGTRSVAHPGNGLGLGKRARKSTTFTGRAFTAATTAGTYAICPRWLRGRRVFISKKSNSITAGTFTRACAGGALGLRHGTSFLRGLGRDCGSGRGFSFSHVSAPGTINPSTGFMVLL